MVLDDDADILNVLAMVLTSEGCVARESLSPEEALMQLDGVDVVVVDQAMPEMTGTEFIAAARGAGARARVLVISAEGRSEQLARAAGAEGFLAKPLDVRRMMGEVERLFALAPR